MEQKFTKKYGLITAIAMVVGIVIGSGVFFKAQTVLEKTAGNMPLGIIAWIIGGLIMMICAATFAVMANKYEKVGGIVDYAEATCGKNYAYYMAWFTTTIYYPGMTSVLAWVSARYFGALFGWSMVGPEVMVLACLFLVGSYAVNVLSPKIAGYVQVSTTAIKLIPLILMAVVGTVAGLVNGTIADSFGAAASSSGGGSLFGAVVATAFAYEGWIIATSINAEIKDSKKNLPLALFLGSAIIMAIYILYFVGVSGAVDVGTLITEGSPVAFTALFGSWFGVVLEIFVVISCLGTLNGLMLASTRSMYVVASRAENERSEFFASLDERTNMPSNAGVIGLLLCAAWLVYFYGANLTSGWFGVFNFDSSELPIITIYGMYFPILINFIRKERDLSVTRRFVLPILALIGSGFMLFATVYAHGIDPYRQAAETGKFVFPVLFYLIVYVVIMALGALYKYWKTPSFCSCASKNTKED